MIKNSSYIWFTVLGGISLVATGASAQDGAYRDNLSLEEVVVTAQRREASLQNVPIAVSAFNEYEMERRQIFNANQIINNIPNIVSTTNPGQNTALSVYIRGIGNQESMMTVDPANGFYIDDAYIARQSSLNLDLFDIERVEILRGPQGTLYGRNSNGGAVKVITKKPVNDHEASGEISYGRYNRVLAKVSMNTPLVEDELFLRISGFSDLSDGYGYNETIDKDVNNNRAWGFRAATRWLASSDLEVLASFDWTVNDSRSLYPVDIGGFWRPVPQNLFTHQGAVDTENKAWNWGGNVTINYALTDNIDLQSITAYRQQGQKYNIDFTDHDPSLFELLTDYESKSFSEELKLDGSAFDNRVDFVAGIFYFREKSDGMIGDILKLDFGDTLIEAPFFHRTYDVDVESIAGFAEINYHLTNNLTAILGGRFTYEKRKMFMDTFAGGEEGFDRVGGALLWDSNDLDALGIPRSLSFNEFTPKAGLQYSFSDDFMTYAHVSRGFRSGSWSARTNDPMEVLVFEPEKVTAYTAGFKSTFWSGRARLNAEGFYYDYTNLFNVAANPDTGEFRAAFNDAEIYGVEIEATARLTSNLDVFAALGVQEGKNKNIPADVADLVARQPQRLPKYSGNIGFTNSFPLTNGDAIVISSNWQYQKDHFTNVQNSPLGRSGDIHIVNASAFYKTGNDRYEIGVSCRNCFDDTYIVTSLDFMETPGFNFFNVYTGEPMTWLLTFRARFH